MATSTEENKQNWRSQVMVGDLPGDFLRFPTTAEQAQINADLQAAQALQAQQAGMCFQTPNLPRLSISIVQAKLSKNYGLTKMDPYCRIRAGHSVFETQTCGSGGKNPRWNKTVYCYIPKGVDVLFIEIFDERSFTMDDRVAWCQVEIPEKVFSEETCDDWYMLSGRQGEGKEGMINLVLSYSPAAPSPAQQVVYTGGSGNLMVVPGMPVYVPQVTTVVTTGPQQQQPQQQQQPMPPQQPPGPLFTEEDVNTVKELFPDTDDEVIKSVLEANRGNKDATINNLLQMSS